MSPGAKQLHLKMTLKIVKTQWQRGKAALDHCLHMPISISHYFMY